ncbi:MAG: hypothetical protein NTW21_27685 [Verrucomicrobia bacterium]|nr:hypothetical protein [Verrucomicrobiota bacterium]
MKTLATWNIITLLFALILTPLHAANEIDAVDGPNVRVTRHKDGSKTIFTRSPSNQVLTKKTFSAAGKLSLITVYRMDAGGNPIGCKIYDGQNNELFKVSYGYRKSDGQLVMERMWDSRVRRTDPKNPAEEMPVQVVRYVIDAQGKRSAPIVFNLLPGKTFEEIYGTNSSALDSNPFQGEKPKNPVNPRAKPAGTR